MRLQSTLFALSHAASGNSSGSVVADAHAGSWGTRARFRLSAWASPSHAWGEQSGNGQNSQKSNGPAHVSCLEAQILILPAFGGENDLSYPEDMNALDEDWEILMRAIVES